MPEEYMEVYTPDELVLIEPENNAEVSEGEEVTFRWTGLGTEEEGWSYSGEIRTESGGSALGFNTDGTSYTVVVPSNSAGNYLWRVIGSRSSSNAPLGLSRSDDGMSYEIEEISISYPRKLIIEPAPAD